MQLGEYIVIPTNEEELVDFLKFNNFTYDSNSENNPLNREHVIVINVINKTYFNCDRLILPSSKRISQSEFLDKIKYHPEKGVEYRVICNDELAYEGLTRYGKPYGLGVSYYPNGNIYQEGVFYKKGIIQGKEYYSSGQLKFAGIWAFNGGYGPNYPVMGNYYDEKGDLIFSGKFEVKKGGVGYPMMKYPRYRLFEKDRPDLKYL